jgi:acylphosphatase
MQVDRHHGTAAEQGLDLERRAEEGVNQVCAHVLVSGLVQGVGFRAWTDREASRLGLHGWVRNVDDGRVEAVFQGPEDLVERMLRSVERGPVSARVAGVETSRRPADPGLGAFTVRP